MEHTTSSRGTRRPTNEKNQRIRKLSCRKGHQVKLYAKSYKSAKKRFLEFARFELQSEQAVLTIRKVT